MSQLIVYRSSGLTKHAQRCALPDSFANVKADLFDLASLFPVSPTCSVLTPEASTHPSPSRELRGPLTPSRKSNGIDVSALLQSLAHSNVQEKSDSRMIRTVETTAIQENENLYERSLVVDEAPKTPVVSRPAAKSLLTGHPLSPPPARLSNDQLLSFDDDETIRASGRSPKKKKAAGCTGTRSVGEFGEPISVLSDDEETLVDVASLGGDDVIDGGSLATSDAESTFSFHVSEVGGAISVGSECDVEEAGKGCMLEDVELEGFDVPPPRPASRLAFLDEDDEEDVPSAYATLHLHSINLDSAVDEEDEDSDEADRAIQRALAARHAHVLRNYSRTDAEDDVLQYASCSRGRSHASMVGHLDQFDEEGLDSNSYHEGNSASQTWRPSVPKLDLGMDDKGRRAVVRRPSPGSSARGRMATLIKELLH
jgi:hypothetical protein